MFNGPRLDRVALDPAKAHIYIPAGFGRRLNYFPTDPKDLGPWEAKSKEILSLETSPYPSRYLSMPWIAIDTGSGTWYAVRAENWWWRGACKCKMENVEWRMSA